MNAVGHFDAHGVHRLGARAYFEDTDLTGVVYHANYLRYMERARSDMLICCGIDQLALLEAGAGYFSVADIDIRFRRSARLGDELTVESQVTRVRAAATVMRQRVRRGDEVLTDASVTACWLDARGRPQRQPRIWATRFEELRIAAAEEN